MYEGNFSCSGLLFPKFVFYTPPNFAKKQQLVIILKAVLSVMTFAPRLKTQSLLSSKLQAQPDSLDEQTPRITSDSALIWSHLPT